MKYLFFILFITFILNSCKEFNPEKVTCKTPLSREGCPNGYKCNNDLLCEGTCEVNDDCYDDYICSSENFCISSCKDNTNCPLKHICSKESICIPGCELKEKELNCEEKYAHCDDTEKEVKCVCNDGYKQLSGFDSCTPACDLVTSECVHGICDDSNGSKICICEANYQDNDFDMICQESCNPNSNICDSLLACDDSSGNMLCDFNNNNGYNGVKTIKSNEIDGNDISSVIKFDSNKNLIIGGTFQSNKIDVDINNLTSEYQLTNTGKNDIFIMKYGKSEISLPEEYNIGNEYLWSYQIKGTDEQILKDFAVCGDFIYLVGIFKGRTEFSLTETKNSNGEYDSFITKINSSGIYEWTKTIGGNEDDIINAIATDSECNVYVTGGFKSTAVLNFSNGEIKNAGDGMDLFVAKYNSSGDFLAEKDFGILTANGIEDDCDFEGKTIVIKDDLVYVGGYKSVEKISGYHKDVLLYQFKLVDLSEGVDIDLTSLNTESSTKEILKYDDIITKLTVDELSGNIWVTGNNKISTLNTGETFIGKLNSDYSLEPSKIYNQPIISINNIFSHNTYIYFCGYFKGNINFDTYNQSDLVDSGQEVWIYLTKMADNKTYEWTQIIKSDIKLSTATEPNSFENLRDIPCSIYVENDAFGMGNDIYLYGTFQGETDFHTLDSEEDIITTEDKTDIFLWRYKENQ